MKKHIYLCVLWAITILIIILIATNKMTGIQFHVTDGDWDVGTKSERNDDSKYTEKIDESLERFENININSNVIELTIKTGSEYHIYSTYNKPKYKPEFNVKNGTLNIRQNFQKSNTGNINCKVEITIPRNAVLNNVDIDNNVGEINLKNIAAKEIDARTNVGEISVDDMDFTNLNLENNVGEISIKTTDGTDNYNIIAKTDIGEVAVNRRSYKRRYEQNNNSKKTIKAIANVGEVTIN